MNESPTPWRTANRTLSRNLLQLCGLLLGFFQDWNIGVGVFPQGEEVLISSFSFVRIFLQRVGTCEPQMRQCTGGAVLDEAAVIQYLLELRGCFGPLAGSQVGLAANISRIKARIVDLGEAEPEFIRSRGLKNLGRGSRSFVINVELATNRGQPN